MNNSFYVYQLRRSDSFIPFYIGKGCGDRIKGHFKDSSLAKRNFKNNCIKKAINDGVEVLAEFVAINLIEESAFEIEKALIKFYGKRSNKTGVLSNLSDGGEGPSGVKLEFTNIHRENLRNAASNQVLLTCPHCNCTCKPAQYKRYHGELCSTITSKKWSNPKIAGKNNMHAKLTEGDVVKIRELVAGGMSKAAVSRIYNTTDSNICKIISKQSWSHVS